MKINFYFLFSNLDAYSRCCCLRHPFYSIFTIYRRDSILNLGLEDYPFSSSSGSSSPFLLLNHQKQTNKNLKQKLFHKNFDFSLPEANTSEFNQIYATPPETMLTIWSEMNQESKDTHHEQILSFHGREVLSLIRPTRIRIRNMTRAAKGR